MKQLQLFDDSDWKVSPELSVVSSAPRGISVEEIDLNLAESTFVGGMSRPVHRWYKLRPSFSPVLASLLFNALRTEETIGALDPFLGAGTTAVECKMRGIPSWGIELNPFLAKYIQYATNWSASEEELLEAKHRLIEDFEKRLDSITLLPLTTACSVLGVSIPAIYNPLRWWRSDVLSVLLALKRVLYDQIPNSTAHRLAWLTLGTVCIEVANIKRLHPTLTFYDRANEHIDVRTAIHNQLRNITEDLSGLSSQHETEATIIQGDSTEASKLLQVPGPVAVVTSPPYPNRYSYVWETRPHLYMMDLLGDPKEAGQLDLQAPGGTWGTATSVLSKGTIEPRTECLKEQLSEPIKALRGRDNLMANYVVKYFNMIDKHFDEMGKLLPVGSRLGYVVGNSRIKEVDVMTESIIAHQLMDKGWARVDKLVVFRRRIGKRALYETTVVATKIC